MPMDSVAKIMFELKVSLFVLLSFFFLFFTLEDVDLLRFDLIRDLKVPVKYCCFESKRMMGAYQFERWFLRRNCILLKFLV